jgi:hypothetical protein
MADMSFKQAKELTEQLELTELTLKKTVSRIDSAAQNFDKALKEQEKILHVVPRTDKKLNNMKLIVALNIGFILGLLVSKYLF